MLKFPNSARLNNRGLSPIFATLIILSVVTILFVPVFIWAAGMTSNTQESWQFSGAQATERIVIEAINLAGPVDPIKPNSCTIYVRNIGETAITINNAIISADNTVLKTFQISTSNTYKPSSNPNPDNWEHLTSVAKGNLIVVYISDLNLSPPLSNGETYSIKLATAKGVSDSYTVVASWPM